MRGGNRIKVLVVEDHPVTRRGLVAILDGYESVSKVAEAGGAMEALTVMREFEADVVVLDISLPDLDGIHVIYELNDRHPDAKVLMVSSSNRTQDISRAFAAGADGYCFKDEYIDYSLRSALRSVCADQFWLDPISAAQLGMLCAASAAKADVKLLTQVESDLLNSIATRRSDVAEQSNQKIIAGIVAKLRQRQAA